MNRMFWAINPYLDECVVNGGEKFQLCPNEIPSIGGRLNTLGRYLRAHCKPL